MEFFLSTLPESLLQEVGPICLTLLGVTQKVKRQEIAQKAEELLVFIREILTCDLVLPHFIAALEETDTNLSFSTIMDYFTTLVLATTGIKEPA